MNEKVNDMEALQEKIEKSSAFIDDIRNELDKVIIGQHYMIDRLLIGLLTNGHVLLEGVRGLAKTLTVSSLAKVISTDFQRIQFTPDLLPADLIGTLIYNQKEGISSLKDPNIILADEIFSKSALLANIRTFFSFSYKNVEQEGTYPLQEHKLIG